MIRRVAFRPEIGKRGEPIETEPIEVEVDSDLSPPITIRAQGFWTRLSSADALRLAQELIDSALALRR